ncbi:Xylose isomerase domain protein TIM barrel [Planctopirus limnophila DSM 3776]|uniref:Xylose isomerase domain protein TIM barrel n=1 Tax=Planctopirus limnophila (strain ATCC 43296 / DSM 3776 / IFAM 1008 / Mu 290) TaxID=521674 RepID=D5SVT3_PLAL2|nr:sugar phosphate isomerase/epimerase family protein [Planctopirus limnophila]ADG69443.1 Xylose isomerase domain protein TIM barrel [Planctopirus limnophila DSM 3776]
MRFAICQELYEGWSWERQCAFSAELGYQGLEVAPFTLAPRITDVSSGQRAEYRRVAQAHGLSIIGLHWLLAKTEGFHLTTKDAAVRQKTAAYLAELARGCADLGGQILVLGSPQQRQLEVGMTKETGMEHAREVLEAIEPVLAETRVTLCLEPLSPKETNFLNTCGEAVALIDQIGSPWIRLHQDVKAMLSEPTPIDQLIMKYASYTSHFHVNDANLLGPGMGTTDFAPIFDALFKSGYAKWVSVEVFDYSPGAEVIARDSIAHMLRFCEDARSC